jgi:hypothetical protein
MTNPVKPDCYLCVHREPLPDIELVACRHPEAMAIWQGPKAAVLLIATGWGPIDGKVLGIMVEPDAEKRGLMTWPFRFLPEGMAACDGYQRVRTDG